MNPRALADAPWLVDPRLRRVFAAVAQDGDEIRAVGGAIRNTLLGLPVNDVDLATTAPPEIVTRRCQAKNMKVVPTGIEHGTVTVIVEGRPFEVTTLREDVETDGRRAVVVFGRDWRADALRRDFTMNALYASADGTIHDEVGGVDDCLARHVRFIGNPLDRLREDYLRILRFFRFHAAHGQGDPDPEGLNAVIRARDGLDRLSAERVGQEMTKLMIAHGASNTVHVMSDCGILQRVLGAAANLAAFERLHAIAESVVILPGGREDWPVLLAALALWDHSDTARLAHRLRLSNTARDRMERALVAAASVTGFFDETDARMLLYLHGEIGYRDGLAIAAARGRIAADDQLAHLIALPLRWQPGRPPVAGRDLAALGIEKGPAIGEFMREAEKLWIESDFTLDRAAILARLGLLSPSPPHS